MTLTIGFIGNGKSTNRYHMPFILTRTDKIKVKTIYNRSIHFDTWKKIEGIHYTDNLDEGYSGGSSDFKIKSSL